MSDHRKIREYVPFTVQLDTELYKTASDVLGTISSSAEEFCALCLLKLVRYMRDIPDCVQMPQDELVRRIVDDVAEELELCYVNKPQFRSKNEEAE